MGGGGASKPAADASAPKGARVGGPLDRDQWTTILQVVSVTKGSLDAAFVGPNPAINAWAKTKGEVEIVAFVPTSEVLRYVIDLRSLTGGRGRFSLQHSHYDPVPSHMVDKLRAQAEPVKV